MNVFQEEHEQRIERREQAHQDSAKTLRQQKQVNLDSVCI